MSRTSTLILLGALTIIVPFSGLPIAIRNLLAAVVGACVLGIGLSMRARAARAAQASASAPAEPITAPGAPSDISPI